MKTTISTFISRTLVAVTLFASVAAVAFPASSAYAANCGDVSGVKSGLDCTKTADQKTDLGAVIKAIINTLLFIIGAVAVVMIIIGGIRYTISNGDSSQITSAKNTILYAVIGLVVALLSYAIVNFVLDSFTPSADGSSQKKTN